MNLKRICRGCGTELTYSCRRSYNRAKKNNSLCRSCNNKKSKLPDNKCIDCGVVITKKSDVHRCKSCAQKKVQTPNHKRHLQTVLKLRGVSDSHLHKIKNGIKEYWKVYHSNKNSDNTDWNVYRNEVRRITNNQPIHLLENYEKRGKAGKFGAYHLDHKISVYYGFHNNIPPEEIGNIDNLRMIPWLDNLKKGSSIC